MTTQKLLAALTVGFLALPLVPAHAQEQSVLIAQASDSVEVDAANAKAEAKLSKELADLRSQVGYMEKLVAEFKKKLEVMTTTMEQMKKSNRKS